MVTVICEIFADMNPKDILEDVQVTIGKETKVTDAKGKCIFNNIKPGIYDVILFKDGFTGLVRHGEEINDSSDTFHVNTNLIKIPYWKLSADKTKIKKNETVTIVAQLFKQDYNVTGINQVSFSINDTQKVISDFDTDKEIAVMTLKGSNQGKVKITAHAQYRADGGFTASADSNVLFIQDGDEE